MDLVVFIRKETVCKIQWCNVVPVNQGVPQGTVFDPILFVLSKSDIVKYIEPGNI